MAWKEKLSGHAFFLNMPMNLDLRNFNFTIKSTNWFYFNLWKRSLHIMNYRPQTTLKWEMKEYMQYYHRYFFFRFSHLTVNLHQNPFHKYVVLVIRIKKMHVLIMSCLHSNQQHTDTHHLKQPHWINQWISLHITVSLIIKHLLSYH